MSGKPGTTEPDRQALIWALHDYAGELTAILSAIIVRAIAEGQTQTIAEALHKAEQEARNAKASRHPLARQMPYVQTGSEAASLS